MTGRGATRERNEPVSDDDSGPVPNGARKERTLSVRVPEETVHLLMGLTLVDDVTLADTIRRALAEYVDSRRSAEGFQDELDAAKRRQLSALDSLEAS